MPAYLLTWNPNRWEWKDLSEAIAALERGEEVRERWSSGTRTTIPPDSRFFLLRQGREPRGIVGSGRTVGSVYRAEHYAADRASSGDTANYVDVVFDRLIDPDKDAGKVLRAEDLKRALPQVS